MFIDFYIFFDDDAAVFASTRRIFSTTTQGIQRVDVFFRRRRTLLPLIEDNPLTGKAWFGGGGFKKAKNPNSSLNFCNTMSFNITYKFQTYRSGPPGIPVLKTQNSRPRQRKNSRKFPFGKMLDFCTL